MSPHDLAVLWIGGTQIYLQLGLFLHVFLQENWRWYCSEGLETLITITLWPLVWLALIYIPEE